MMLDMQRDEVPALAGAVSAIDMLPIASDEPAANEDSLTEPSNVSAVVIVLSVDR